MITRAVFGTVAALGLCAVTSVAHAETRIAVLPIQHRTGVAEADATLITELVTGEAAKRADLKVIGPTELKALVSFEQQRELLACSDDSCLAELGAALGVDAIITGSLGRFGGRLVFTLSLMDIKATKVLARTQETVANDGELLQRMPALVSSLLKAIPGGSPSAGVTPRAGDDAQSAAPSADNAGATQDAKGGTAAGAEGANAPTQPQTGQAAGSSTAGKTAGSQAGSSLPRRGAGLAVVGLGGALLVGAVLVGLASVGYLLAGRFAAPALGAFPIRYAGFGVAGAADVLGIIALVVMAGGVVVAVLP